MDGQIRGLLIGVLALLGVAVWAFPQWYPLVNRQSVVVAFPGLELEAQADFLLLPPAVRQAYQELREGNNRNPPQPEVALALVRARLLTEDNPAPPELGPFQLPPGSSILRRGTFLNNREPYRGAEGGVLIYQLPDTSTYLRLEDFRTTRAPDLRIVLTRNPDPYDPQGVRVDYIDLGPLVYSSGNQNYAIPRGVDFSQYPTLALYSPSLNFVISSATLR
ncbi:MAG: DM13 domain-containing protein [Anaerolineae bacterium]|nr:DM13 domain-containing protein [Anaerolineae bacterium]MDW8172166.1 DM13 domain-containing protein [Anaerolineae bacterium]